MTICLFIHERCYVSLATKTITIMGKLKIWSTIDSVANWVGSLVICKMHLDMAKWQP